MKELGEVQDIDIDIDSPMKMTHKLNYNKLVLMCGLNGTGKSVILKLTWLFQTYICHMLMAKKLSAPHDPEVYFQYLLDNTLPDHKMNGHIEYNFKYGNSLRVEFDKGTVMSVKSSLDPEVEECAQAVFMSKDTRLVKDWIQYMKVKKMMGLGNSLPTNEADFGKLLSMYRLYDIIFLEQQFVGIDTKMSPDIIKDLNKRFETFDKNFHTVFADIKIDFNKGDILYTDDKGVSGSLSNKLSDGEAALFTMILAQTLQNY